MPTRKPATATALSRPLTKSRFIQATECPRKLFYSGKKEYGDTRDGNRFLESLAQGGFQVGALAKLRFPGGKEIVRGTYEAEAEQTRLLLSQPEATIYEAAFLFDRCFVRADVAVRRGDELFLYEVKAKSWNPEEDTFLRKDGALKADWKRYLYDIAFQTWVAARAYPELKIVPHLCFANKTAVASVDGINQHFVLLGEDVVRVSPPDLRIEDLGADLLHVQPVAKEITGLITPELVDHLSGAYHEDRKLPPQISSKCKGCEYRVSEGRSGFDECWRDAGIANDTNASKPRVFDVWNFRGADKLLEREVYFLEQMREEDCRSKNEKEGEGFSTGDRRWLQVEKARRNDETHAVHPGLKAEIASWRYPLHFIDFETVMVALPFHRGRRPYEQIAFQFSHHVAHADGRVTHAGEWISTERGKFPNFDFVRQLKQQLEKDNGTVLRYAAHENTVLCQIYRQLEECTEPDRDALLAWIRTIAKPTGAIDDPWEDPGRMVDMLDVLKKFYFHPQMGGSNSIKALLPAILTVCPELKKQHGLSEDPYKDLPPIFQDVDPKELENFFLDEDDDVREGGAAMMAFAKMQFTEMSDEERRHIRAALLRYCELDTLAMVLVWQAWRQIA